MMEKVILRVQGADDIWIDGDYTQEAASVYRKVQRDEGGETFTAVLHAAWLWERSRRAPQCHVRVQRWVITHNGDLTQTLCRSNRVVRKAPFPSTPGGVSSWVKAGEDVWIPLRNLRLIDLQAEAKAAQANEELLSLLVTEETETSGVQKKPARRDRTPQRPCCRPPEEPVDPRAVHFKSLLREEAELVDAGNMVEYQLNMSHRGCVQCADRLKELMFATTHSCISPEIAELTKRLQKMNQWKDHLTHVQRVLSERYTRVNQELHWW